MNPTIEPFSDSQQEPTQSFLRVALRDDDYPLDFTTRDSDLQDIMSHYQNRGGAFWLLTVGEAKRVVGTLGLERVNEDTLELRRFVVDHPLRDKGFGERLLLTALRHAPTIGCRRIRVQVGPRSEAAIHLLGKHRFNEIKRFSTDPRSMRFFERWIQTAEP